MAAPTLVPVPVTVTITRSVDGAVEANKISSLLSGFYSTVMVNAVWYAHNHELYDAFDSIRRVIAHLCKA